MKKLIGLILFGSTLLSGTAFAALASGAIYEIRASATTGNVNAAGFNPANANGFTDLTTDANTANTNSPVVSSASYNFAAADVNAWLYIVSGTNWKPGWYQIASVASNKATLSAAVGSAVLRDTTTFPHKYYTNTSAGCATVGTPTGGTFLIDYSQQDTAQDTHTNLTCTAGSTTVTSASAPFTRMMVGNHMHITAQTGGGGVASWYEIVSFTDTSNVVLDRSPASGTNITAATYYVGGAGRWNGLEDASIEITNSSSFWHIKNGSYTISGAISIASTDATSNLKDVFQGYNTVRGDTCTGSNRPVLTAGANNLTFGQHQELRNFKITGTASPVVTTSTGGSLYNVSIFNTSSTASRNALNFGSNSDFYYGEALSLNGTALNSAQTGTRIFGSYAHDSVTGITYSGNNGVIENTIVQAAFTTGVNLTSSSGTASVVLSNLTIYGDSGKNCGTGLYHNSATISQNTGRNLIISGWTKGVNQGSTNQTCHTEYTDFYNNTTDITAAYKSPLDIAVDPAFTDAAQINGTTATTSGSVLTQSGGDFSTVEDNVDVLRVISGTGVTTGGYLITGHTSNTLTTNNALGSSVAGDVVYFIPTGHNFTPGTNLKAAGFPGAFPGSASTGYMDIGAVQRQEAGSSTDLLGVIQ